MAIWLNTSKLFWVVDGGPGLNVVVEDGSLPEWIVLLRFVDIMNGLEPEAMYMMESITWRGNEVGMTLGVYPELGGEPFPRDFVERVGARMAKVLWNLGGPPHVWLTDEFAVYRFDWIKEEVTA
jgi:hypothetical protein